MIGSDPHTTIRPIRRLAVLAAALVAIAAGALTFGAGDALALCSPQEEHGLWRNTDPRTRGIVRIQLVFFCNDTRSIGIDDDGTATPSAPAPDWLVHAWGACAPAACDWGEVTARRLESGYVLAVIDHGFARRYLWARMDPYGSGLLYVALRTDFTSPARRDYTWYGYFERVV